MEDVDKILEDLLPNSDGAIALLRMPADERLPKYRANSLYSGGDVPERVKELIRQIGS